MKKTLRTSHIIGRAGLAASAFCATPAFAQSVAVDDAIIVTARRQEERLQDVPISITVFNQEQIADLNIVTASDIAVYTPSLTTNTRYGVDNPTFSIRGFSQEGITSPSVAVYFADVVSPRANGSTTGGNGGGPGSFFDLQNVQVLKGPQGTLFGRNTTGGAILLVPQKPTDRLEGYVEGSLGNYDMRRLQAVVNIPANDSVRIRLGMDRQTRDGYVNNISGIGPADFADVSYWALRASLVVDVSPDIENYTILSYSDSDTNGFFPKVYTSNFSARTSPRVRNAILSQLAATSNFYDVLNDIPGSYQESRQWSAINTTTWRVADNLTIKNIVSYAEFEQSTNGNLFGDYVVTSNSPLTVFSAGVNLRNVPGSDNVSQWTFTEELQLVGSAANDRLSYQFGGYLELSRPLGDQRTNSNQTLLCTDALTFQCTDIVGREAGQEGRVGQIAEVGTRYRFRNLGVYGQATFDITEQLSITGGLRYTSDVTSGVGQALTARFFTPNTPTWSCSVPSPLTQGGTSAEIRADPSRCDFERRVSSAKPTWLIGVDFEPKEDVLLYAKYTRGYRQGSVNVSLYGLETWEPEKVDSYEIGAKTSFSGPVRGTFNVAAFYNDLSNQQLLVSAINCSAAELVTRPAQCPFIASVAAGIANAGKSVIQGVEVEATFSPLPGLNLAASYAYLDAKLESSEPVPPPLGFSFILNRAVVGDQLPLIPKNKYTLSANYTLPLSESVGKVSLGATFTHQDSSFGSAGSPPGQQFLPPQDNLNLNLNWDAIAGSPFDASLFVTNVTKEKYFVALVGTSFGWDAAVLNPPRMFGVRLKYRFGQ